MCLSQRTTPAKIAPTVWWDFERKVWIFVKKKCKRTIAAVAALVFAMQGAAILPQAYAARPLVSTFAESSSQMNSQPEVVYVSRYGQSKQRTESFVDNWKFYLGDASGAEKTNYNDASWRQIDLPHDYSIEQEFSQSMEAESGYLPGGIGWYRKSFTIDPSQQGKRVRVDFDGVYMDSTIWVNGVQVATHPYGYSPFSVDITEQVKFGEENLIAVKVNHQTPSSRWYSGSGIYRDVNLTITNPVHVDLGGTQITTPDLEKQAGKQVDMKIATTIVNNNAEAANVSVTHTLYEKGKDVAKGSVTVDAVSVDTNSTKKVDATLKTSEAPNLWSTDTPNLYTVRTEIKSGDTVLDSYDTTYGFRYFKFDHNTGFSLNGQNMKLKGVCMHHDQGALGAVNNRRAVERQVEILMDMGCNSIRVTHNPASQNLIDVCNEKGILVVEEIFDGWMYPKNTNRNDFARFFNETMGTGSQLCHAAENKTWAQYSLQQTLLRDRNAPSVIMWSLGNEIQEGTNIYTGYAAKVPDLIKWAQEIDTSNPLTVGSNSVKNGDLEQINVANKITAAGGVSGTNYSDGNSYDRLHRQHSDWLLYGSETASSVNSRGIYNRTHDSGRTSDKQLTSYDNSKVHWGAFANDAWRDVIQRDFVAGEYVWTGFDYIGEPTHWNGTTGGTQGPWPAPKNSYFGIIDTAGFPKDSYYLYRSQWNTEEETLHILPAWNSQVVVNKGTGNVPVVVYASNADTVKLTLIPSDGSAQQTFTKELVEKTSQGGAYKYRVAKDNENKLYVEFNVPYKDGTLKAESFKDGKLIKTTEIKTAGAPAKLHATVDTTNRTVRADGKDLIYVTVDVTDAEGNLVPYAENRVHIKVDGPGKLVGVDNGNSPDHDSYKGKSRKAFGGKMLAIVQTTKNAGDITITASADNLESQTVRVTTKPVESTEQKTVLDGFYMSKSYYVKAGTIPTIPTTVEARFSDGSKQNVDVTWDEITADQVAKAGSFPVKGTVRVNDVDYSLTVLVHVLENVGGMLNYSTTTQKGTKPTLPAQRPVVMSDGTILDVEFPVKWTIPEESAFNTEEEVVVVNGTADVLGTTYPVTANVRVQKEIITIGDSVSSAAHLKQDIPAEQQSDTLEAIKNGSTTIDANHGGNVNTSVWSNYKASNEFNDTTAEITFSYDTQQSIGEAVIHFASDSWSMRYPEAGTTEIWISEGGNEWTKVDATETIGTEKDRVTPYTYKFAPFTATMIKLKLTNTTAATGTSAKACTGITEVELKKAEGSFVTNHDAQLESLVINGHNVPAAQLNVSAGKKGTTAVNAAFAEVTAAGKGNAAVTVLPAYKDVIHIIVEAEDHSARSFFDIQLNKETSFPADDPSRDYPRESTTGIAGSQLSYVAGGNEGPVRLVVDGDPSTHWHTNWGTTEATDVNKRWVGLDMGAEKPIVGVRVLPRQSGNTNGATTEYRIDYSNDNKNWTPVPGATGTWSASDRNWKVVEFNEPVNAQYIRVVGVHTSAADGSDKHMSMSEMRALKPGEGDLTKCTIKVPESVKVSSVSKENPAMVNPVIKNGETTLSYGYDYTLKFTDNDKFGTATVTATGIGQYTGELTATFQIVKSDATAESIAVKTAPTKTSYTAGETFDPTGLVLTISYSDGTTTEVLYSKDDANFTFAPALDAKLTVDNKTVTVTYGEKTAEISITVTEATGPDSLDKEIERAKAVDLNQYENNLEKVVFVSALRNAESLPAGASEAARANAAAQLYQARQNLAPKA